MNVKESLEKAVKESLEKTELWLQVAQQDKTLARKILDFLGLEVSKSWNGKLRIFFKESKHLVFNTVVEDEVHAAWTILHSSCVYDVRHGKSTIIENPFYGKSIDEIRVMLDLLESEKEV